jgi:hypothetical protein
MFGLYIRASRALRYAAKRHAPGLPFASYGRRIGRRLLMKRMSGAWDYSIAPVSIVRYFEFPFTLGCLPNSPGDYLDVSSPRLFSYYVAEHGLAKHIDIINPDRSDAALTQRIALALDIQNITVRRSSVDSLVDCSERYDCIWAISVIEHIAEPYNDTFAIKLMFDALKRNGCLILTIPVDKKYWEEFREGIDPYGTQPTSGNGKYFFQRHYDLRAIQQRLIEPIGLEPTKVSWFGEKTPGLFQEYIQRWIREGDHCAVDDPREIADNYQEYATWDVMPGAGVCGLCIRKGA